MWFHSALHSCAPSARRRQQRAANSHRLIRSLILEGLEDRRLLAFNVLAVHATGPNPTDLALAQIDAGNQLDLVIANDSATQGSIRLGNTDGTFKSAQSTGTSSSSLATGDLNGDGITDLVSLGANVMVQTGNGNGTFQPPLSISLPPQVAPGNPDPTPLAQTLRSVVAGDLNADGKLDLVVVGQTSFDQYYRYYTCGYYGCGYIGFWNTRIDGYVNVLMGNGNGGFSATAVHQLGSDRSPSAIAIGDLNGDGNADVVTANKNGFSTLLGAGSGALVAPIHSGNGTASKSLFLGDIDGDGLLDTVSRGGNFIIMQQGQGDGRFVGLAYTNIGHPVESTVVGDVNGDGQLDIVAVGSLFTCNSSGYYGCYDFDYSGQASVILGDGTGGFSLPISSLLGTNFYGKFVDVVLADLTGDGMPELVTIESLTGMAIVASNDGKWVRPVELAISNASITEGHSGTVNAVFTVTLANPSQSTVTIDYATADLAPDEQYWYGRLSATAGVDYTPSAGTLIIPAGQTSATITVPVHGDRIGESDELFFVNLSNPVNAILTIHRGVGTILNDEPYVSFEYYSGPEVVEGDSGTKPMTFIVELSVPYDIPVTVDYATMDGSARVGSDYQATTGTLTFLPGQITKTFSVQVIGDTQPEYDEYFYVNLANASHASIGTGQKTGYIIDNDSLPEISISDAWLYEGNSGTKQMTFDISLSQPSTQTVRVNYATTNGTAMTSDNDYVAKSGTLSFKPGETRKTINISIKGDKKQESDEWFFVNLLSASGATIAEGQGRGLILNDDGSIASRSTKSNAASVDAALAAYSDSFTKKRSR